MQHKKIRNVEAVRHSAIIALHLYLDRRTEMGRATGGDIQGISVVVKLDREQQLAVGPSMADVRSLVQSIVDSASRNAVEAISTCKNVARHLPAMSGIKFEIEVLDPVKDHRII